MIIVINTENNQITVDGKEIELDKPNASETGLADAMMEYQGQKEYDGIVAEIQKWFYGWVSRTAWCATCVSYFANKIGKLNAIGGKNENVYAMMTACRKAADIGYGQIWYNHLIPITIKKNDIIFLLWGDTVMKSTSNKHVCVASEDSTGQTVACIGGNQNDSLCIKLYNRSDIYAVYRMK